VSVNDETIAVASPPESPGCSRSKTRASSGVGVAISVTTIPAAPYLGVASGLGEVGKALGALAVVGTNVAVIVIGAAVTLGMQRLLGRLRRPQQHRG
jgi:hypothetical protein